MKLGPMLPDDQHFIEQIGGDNGEIEHRAQLDYGVSGLKHVW